MAFWTPSWQTRQRIRTIRVALSHVALYITIAGIGGFACFILEESIQTVMFGTWAAKDAKNWAQVARGIRIAENFRTQMRVVNNTVGWINPYGWLSYKAYADAATYWAESTKLQVLANDPVAMDGIEVDFDFTPDKVTVHADGYALTSTKITVVTKKVPNGMPVRIQGIVHADGNRVLIKDE